MSEIGDLYFELSNEARLEALMLLRKGPMNLTGISRKIGISNQECSRHMARLTEAKLVEKSPESLYGLTPYGELVLRLHRGQDFVSEHREYFTTHTLDGVPHEFVGRLGELSGCAFVDDVMVVFHNISRMYREAEEYAYRMTDRWLLMVLQDSIDATERGVEMRLLEEEAIPLPPGIEATDGLEDAWRKGTFKDRILGDLPAFIAMSEKEVAALAFPTTEGRFDYLGFTAKDEKAHKWCKDVFEYYWEKGKDKTAFTWLAPSRDS